MRRFGVGLGALSLLALVGLGALFGPSAQAAGVARLAGVFRTVSTVTDAGKVVGQHAGEQETSNWTFRPACASGGCATSVTRTSVFDETSTETLTPDGAGRYTGHPPDSTAPCEYHNGTVRVADAYATSATLTLDVSSTVNGQGTAITGEVVVSFAQTARVTGNPFCPATSETYTFAGSLRAGTNPLAAAGSSSPSVAGPTGGSSAPAATSSSASAAPLGAAPSRPAGTTPPPRRSVLASGLHSPATVFGNLPRDLVNALIAAAAVLLITFPSQLFNHTFEEHYEEIAAGWTRRTRRLRAAWPVRRRLGSGRAAFVVVSLGGAVLGCLLNPSVGFNAATGVSFVGTLIAVVIGTLLSLLVPRIYRAARGRDQVSRLEALPAGLLVGAVCVLISRLSDFQPGYLYGVVAGVTFTVTLAAREQAHVVGLSHGLSLVLSALAWFAWIPVDHAASAAGAGWGIVLLDDVLGAMVVGGLVGNAINLLPLRFLPGAALWSWRRVADVALLAVTMLGFVAILLNPTDHPAHGSRAPLVTIVVLLVLFGGASIGFAAYWNHRDEREEKEADEGTPEPEPEPEPAPN